MTFSPHIPPLHAVIGGSRRVLRGGGWADRSKAAGKQAELGRNAGGGDALPPGRAKIYIFFYSYASAKPMKSMFLFFFF